MVSAPIYPIDTADRLSVDTAADRWKIITWVMGPFVGIRLKVSKVDSSFDCFLEYIRRCMCHLSVGGISAILLIELDQLIHSNCIIICVISSM